MRRIDPRLLIGILLVVGGVLSLLDVQGVISNAGGIFWGMIWAAGGLFFLYMLMNDPKSHWLPFPAFTLLGLAASSFLTGPLEDYDGLVFFAGISLGFWWVYFNDRQRWWAILPAGFLLTLGIVSALENVPGMRTGGSLFLGMGLTFLLVAVLSGERSRSWALIPGIVLLILGVILGTPFFGMADYFWPAVLILLGGFLVFRFLRGSPG